MGKANISLRDNNHPIRDNNHHNHSKKLFGMALILIMLIIGWSVEANYNDHLYLNDLSKLISLEVNSTYTELTIVH